MINFVSSNLNIGVKEKQEILSLKSMKDRALACLKQMDLEYQKLALKNDIQSKVRHDLDQQQREYYLHQQLKTIQEELGGVSYEEEVEEMRARALEKSWNEETQTHFFKESGPRWPPGKKSAFHGCGRSYLANPHFL